MKKIPPYSVIVNYDILEYGIKLVQDSYPNENGLFLKGSKFDNKESCYEIDGWYFPESLSDQSSWRWNMKDLHKAVKWAANHETRLFGWFHSHPWPSPLFKGPILSETDEMTQKQCGFEVSLIATVWPSNQDKLWWVMAWQQGRSCPLKLLISKDGNIYSWTQWLRTSEAKKGIWKDCRWKLK